MPAGNGTRAADHHKDNEYADLKYNRLRVSTGPLTVAAVRCYCVTGSRSRTLESGQRRTGVR